MRSDGELKIQVNHLVVEYDARRVLDDVSLSIYAGEVFVILGGSGCGKTTLMNHMIGLLKPVSGEIIIGGDDIVTAVGEDRLTILSRIGVMFQSGALFGSKNLLENVRVPLEELAEIPEDAMDAVALNKLKLVGLGDYANFMPAQISGGMQKRAAIARAIALDPEIVFLDEPSAGLDPITSSSLDHLIKDLAKNLNISFVVVTHELASIEAIADRAIMLHDGKVVARGSISDLKTKTDNPYVQQFFNREATHG
mgnify:CR=1 FL=1|jgi:phospholipid/cholesterol/gamma-HCH transport system ATP-binding protein